MATYACARSRRRHVEMFVSARLWNGFLRTLALQRIDVDDLVGDLPGGENEGRDGAKLIEWDVVAELAERLERRLGGPDALEELGASIVSSRPMPALRSLAGWAASSSTLYRFGLRWLSLNAPREFTSSLETGDDGRLEIRVALPATARKSPPLFRMLAGAARALPGLLDLPDALVESHIGPHSATFHVTPPGSGTLFIRARRAVRTLLGSNEALEQLEQEQHLLRRNVDVLGHALAEATQREASLRNLVEAASELLLEVGEDGRIRAASDSAQHVTGYQPSQIIGSHLSLWFHRDDNEGTRRFLSQAFAGDDTAPLEPLRARHERGEWIIAQLEARRLADSQGERCIVVALREVPKSQTEGPGLRTEARLQRLERRHRDLRELQPKMLEAERVAVTRDLADLMDRAIAAPLHDLVDQLEAHAHLETRDAHALALIANRARQVEGGLDRTLDTLRRAKLERTSCSVATIVDDLESTLRSRLVLDGVDLDTNDHIVSGTLRVDRALLGVALEHVAEHLCQRVVDGERVAMEVGACAEREALRITLWPDPSGDHLTLHDGASEFGALVDLELARGLLRAHGGDIAPREGTPGQIGLELTLPTNP